MSECKVVSGLAVSDMYRARVFYEERLGLSKSIGSEGNRASEYGEGTVLHV